LRQFYISDPKIFDLDISAFDFRLYEYLCKNYDLKRLSLLSIDYKPLITHKNFTYFDMPRYKHFLESIKFRKNYSRGGWSKLKQNINSYKNGAYE